jgi:surface antigen
MTYQEFVKKYLGKGIDWDKKYGNQCVDVYRQYCHELGFKQSPPVVGAKDIWDTYLKSDWDRVTNTPDGVPLQGDVIIWGDKVGKYGHVGICDSANKSSFISIDQNWPDDGGTGVLKQVKHTYTGVLGWLRSKIEPVTISQPDMTDEQKRILDFIGTRTEGDVREAFGYLNDKAKHNEQMATLSQKVLELDRFTKELQEKIDVLDSEVTASNEIILKWQSEAQSAKEEARKATAQIQQANEEKNKYRRLYEGLLNTTVEKTSIKDLLTVIINRLFKK